MAGVKKVLDEIEAENFEILSDISDETVAILRQAEIDIANGKRGMPIEDVIALWEKQHGFKL